MTEEKNLTDPVPTTGTFTINTEGINAGAWNTTTSYVPFPAPNYYTYGFPTTWYAQLTEAQLSDIEQRFRRVMRAELAHVLSALYESVKDYEEIDLDEEDEDDEEA